MDMHETRQIYVHTGVGYEPLALSLQQIRPEEACTAQGSRPHPYTRFPSHQSLATNHQFCYD